MNIPLIYVLIGAEILLVLLGLCITFAVLLMRKPEQVTNNDKQSLDDTEAEQNEINLGSSYIDFLDQAMQRNTIKISQKINIEEDEAKEEPKEESTEATPDEPDESGEADENAAPAPDEKQSELLEAREQFLLIEKAAAENSEHDIKFWDSLYEGLQTIIDKYKSTETVTKTINETGTIETESKENVFYIETQGKKIDGEVNKLKDIITGQENALSSMQKAISDAEGELPEDSPSLATLKEQISIIERQLSDSTMCMDILEMENKRLQEEVDKMDSRHDALFSESEDSPETGKESDVDSGGETSNEDGDAIKSKISSLEEELIKKDVAYAKLQDEFSSMETEYLAMYEAMHGDNS